MKKLFTVLIMLIATSGVWGQTTVFNYSGGGSAPTGWTFTDNVATNVIDQSSYWLVDAGSPSDLILTDSYDLSSYSYAIFDIDVATYGNGTAHPAKIEISFDNGSSFTQTTTSATPSSSTYITGGPITLNSVSTQVIIRISNNGTSGRGVRLQNLVLTGYSLKPEPTNHVTNFSAVQGTPIHSSLDLSWTDAAGGTVPDGYLIKGSDVGYGSITDPVDGTAEADGGLVLNIAQGISTATFSGLNSETTYYFMIYPYTNTGDVIDYKTDGTVPSNDVATGAAPSLPNAWINEIHYDNGTPSTDANEGIEVVIENPSGYTLSDFSVILYNGSGGVVYDSKTVDNFTAGDIDNNFQYFYYMYPVNGIQNGPDGVALSYLGSLIQFLSYEGSFAATDGDANGITSTDIVVVEGGTTTDIQSLQLVGSGTQYSDFTWSADLTQTWGTANNGTQALPVELTSFTAYASANQVNLKWATATEVNNYGFEVERAVESPASSKTDYAGTGWEKIGFVEGAGNSNSPVEYNYIDKSVSNAGTYLYRLKQVDLDGAFEYSDEIEVTFAAPNKYQLEQNYPNPFNPVTSIKFSIPQSGQVSLKVFNTLGEEVANLLNNKLEAGYHTIEFDASMLSSGIYFYRLSSNNFVAIKKMLLLK